MRNLELLLLLLICFSAASTHGQFLEDHSIIYNQNGSIVIGRILNENSDHLQIEAFNDTLILYNRDIDYQYRAKRVGVLNDGEFHVVSGYSFNINLGASLGTFGTFSELSIHRKFSPKLSVNAALIGHELTSQIEYFDGALVRNLIISSSSSSITLGGRYFFSDHIMYPDKYRMCGHLSIGHGLTEDSDSMDNTYSKNGFIAQYGLGVQWANKRSTKYFVQLSQIHQKNKGRVNTRNSDGSEVPVEYNLWMNNVMISFGCEINIQLKSK